MDLGISQRAALVCASTSGLGEAIARGLAAEGVRVALSGRREDRGAALAAELPGSVFLRTDLTAPGAAGELFAAAQAALGRVDILVLNGGGPPPSTAAGTDRSALEAAMQLLLYPAQSLVESALPAMRSQRWGRILAVGSSGVVEPIPGLALSNVGRGALSSCLKTLAAEVAPDGVTVNMILPGRIATDRTTALDNAAAVREGTSPEEVQERSARSIPAGRYGRPREFAAAATFLCGESASYVTGVQLRVDGGMAKSF